MDGRREPASRSRREDKPVICEQCAAELPPGQLSCPHCHRLVHAAELKSLAAGAQAAAAAGDASAELAAWRRALELLPAGTRQAEVLAQKVLDLSHRVDRGALASAGPASAELAGPASAPDPAAPARRGALAGGGAAATALAFLLTKGKLLLLGFTKAGTVLTMLLSFGVYWTAFGWKFALGLVLSIYIHEMGHVAALQRFGLRASFPMFIPGLGAIVRLRQRPADPREDARIGLAGPLWGLGAALAAGAVFLAGGGPLWAAICRTGAWINLFNLLPVWQLDGGRAWNALSRPQRLAATAALAAAWALTREGLLVLLCLFAVLRCLQRDAPREGDRTAFAQYLLLVAALSALTVVIAPLPAAASHP
jgi:Zn-dependent protease